MNLEELMASTPPMQQHALIKGFQAGAASRDAEVAMWIERVNSWTRDCDRLADERDKLRAQINVLRESLEEIEDTACDEASHQYIALTALAYTPDQSLAEYRNKVIDDVERYRWLRGYMASERTDLDDEIVEACSTDKPEKLDAFIDTAIRAMKE